MNKENCSTKEKSFKKKRSGKRALLQNLLLEKKLLSQILKEVESQILGLYSEPGILQIKDEGEIIEHLDFQSEIKKKFEDLLYFASERTIKQKENKH